MDKKKVLVFTGAGISAESGVKTFRDHNGLWNDFKVEEVATIDAWHANPQKVIDFYNIRKNEMKGVVPNAGHIAIAELEKYFDVTVVTQNVDDLHEKAGSTRVIHLHGRLDQLKGQTSDETRYPYSNDLKMGDVCTEGTQLRPNIVWFGEDLNPEDLGITQMVAEESDVCIIVGTSMQVSPANQIPWLTPELALVYYVDPGERDFHVPKFRMNGKFFTHVKKKGTEGIPEVIDEIKKIFIK